MARYVKGRLPYFRRLGGRMTFGVERWSGQHAQGVIDDPIQQFDVTQTIVIVRGGWHDPVDQTERADLGADVTFLVEDAETVCIPPWSEECGDRIRPLVADGGVHAVVLLAVVAGSVDLAVDVDVDVSEDQRAAHGPLRLDVSQPSLFDVVKCLLQCADRESLEVPKALFGGKRRIHSTALLVVVPKVSRNIHEACLTKFCKDKL